ncbi:octaheme c-type cytochrome (tetrathionate reductase family) [Rhodovulum bhavnagarense]|uniref:Octaheme c-type cytochrome (Tetrathionate reductase family) n=1 Tax=Rhodovulum bhavnagarense TaxID=992286 RepID=A0A4V2SWR5_9RHOB|nr:tetrathionate reductase family octaheme c-type cytochrome [Rhodovulum bhavnagarense]TCP63336.1 octaheme c-type cytochrome (tetrathionate reductase family) [Rhodovulum bhavnagarense]
MRKLGLGRIVLAVVLGMAGPAALWAQETPQISESTADHSKFKELQKDFASGPEVTAACLSCHTEAATQVKHSIHWKWEFDNPTTGQTLGKRHVLNSFCGNVASNEPRCTSCHVGYGWDDMDQPPPAQDAAVDCLVCHDTSGQYTKLATGAGHPPMAAKGKTITGADAWVVDLKEAAQSVGEPTRQNCGSCHFYGGGGDNVKHGDLSSALYHPARDVDVHMAEDGLNFTCETCHHSDKHVFAGSRYDVHATDPEGAGQPGMMRKDVATCESCHGDTPHDMLTVTGIKLNDHVDRVACQTCHIPSFARGGVATKTRWDWSTAGKMDEQGQPLHLSEYTQGDGKELHTYLATKGDFEYGENVVPYYSWFNGQVDYTTADEVIDPSQVVEVNRIAGSAEDGRSRIWPFKRMEGRQAYDSVLNHLVYSNVWGPTTETAFWTNFDWGKAIEAGMKAAGAEYSGQYGFVDTHMYWPITHMVAPSEDAVACDECHTSNGRLAGLAGFYMPGSQPFSIGGILGMLVFVAMAGGVLLHTTLRVIMRGGKKGTTHD